MSTTGLIGEEIDKQAALAGAALQNATGVASGTSARQLFPRAVLEVLGPYSAALYIAERVVQSDVFKVELVQALYAKLLPFERIADILIASARQQGYFEDPDTAEPLRWLETCNEQVKDCLVALESMLDPELDDLMASAIEEHRRGETTPMDSVH